MMIINISLLSNFFIGIFYSTHVDAYSILHPKIINEDLLNPLEIFDMYLNESDWGKQKYPGFTIMDDFINGFIRRYSFIFAKTQLLPYFQSEYFEDILQEGLQSFSINFKEYLKKNKCFSPIRPINHYFIDLIIKILFTLEQSKSYFANLLLEGESFFLSNKYYSGADSIEKIKEEVLEYDIEILVIYEQILEGIKECFQLMNGIKDEKLEMQIEKYFLGVKDNKEITTIKEKVNYILPQIINVHKNIKVMILKYVGVLDSIERKNMFENEAEFSILYEIFSEIKKNFDSLLLQPKNMTISYSEIFQTYYYNNDSLSVIIKKLL